MTSERDSRSLKIGQYLRKLCLKYYWYSFFSGHGVLDLRTHALVTYLLTQLTRTYKTGNISETVADRAKVTINGLYKVVRWLLIATKVYDYDLE